jgi:hypothetical protein
MGDNLIVSLDNYLACDNIYVINLSLGFTMSKNEGTAKAKLEKIKSKKRIHDVFYHKDVLFPALLTIIIIICLMFLIMLMCLSHALGPMDRQYIAQFSGMFGVAFTSCCMFWLKDTKPKREDEDPKNKPEIKPD